MQGSLFEPGETPLWLLALASAWTAVFLFFVISELLRDLSSHKEVTADSLRGIVSVYLLLGFAWAMVFMLIVCLDPQALAGSETLREQLARQPNELYPMMIYYSFVTLTTLGYGDISPVSEVARSAAWIEAVVGQLFVAVLVARLVGIYVSQNMPSTSDTK